MDRDNGPPNDENDFSILISMTWCDSSFKDENEFLFASNNVDSHSPPPPNALSCSVSNLIAHPVALSWPLGLAF